MVVCGGLGKRKGVRRDQRCCTEIGGGGERHGLILYVTILLVTSLFVLYLHSYFGSRKNTNNAPSKSVGSIDDARPISGAGATAVNIANSVVIRNTRLRTTGHDSNDCSFAPYFRCIGGCCGEFSYFMTGLRVAFNADAACSKCPTFGAPMSLVSTVGTNKVSAIVATGGRACSAKRGNFLGAVTGLGRCNVSFANAERGGASGHCVVGRVGKVGINVVGCACDTTNSSNGVILGGPISTRSSTLVGSFGCGGASGFCGRTRARCGGVGSTKTSTIVVCVR